MSIHVGLLEHISNSAFNFVALANGSVALDIGNHCTWRLTSLFFMTITIVELFPSHTFGIFLSFTPPHIWRIEGHCNRYLKGDISLKDCKARNWEWYSQRFSWNKYIGMSYIHNIIRYVTKFNEFVFNSVRVRNKNRNFSNLYYCRDIYTLFRVMYIISTHTVHLSLVLNKILRNQKLRFHANENCSVILLLLISVWL